MRWGLMTVLCVGVMVLNSGCAAVAVVPGLAGVGAGGYLWGKEVAGEKPAVEQPFARPPAERRAAGAVQ